MIRLTLLLTAGLTLPPLLAGHAHAGSFSFSLSTGDFRQAAASRRLSPLVSTDPFSATTDTRFIRRAPFADDPFDDPFDNDFRARQNSLLLSQATDPLLDTALSLRDQALAQPPLSDTFVPTTIDTRTAGDAGDRPLTARRRVLDTPPQTIQGTLSSSRDVDMFAIDIDDPESFAATTDNRFRTVDTQLFLFDEDGFGVLANDDSPGSLAAELPAGALDAPAGTFFLAVAAAGVDPVSEEGDIFPDDALEVNEPTGPGGDEPLNDWEGAGPTGTYQVDLRLTNENNNDSSTTTTIAHAPTPTAIGPGLVMLTMLFMRRQRQIEKKAGDGSRTL